MGFGSAKANTARRAVVRHFARQTDCALDMRFLGWMAVIPSPLLSGSYPSQQVVLSATVVSSSSIYDMQSSGVDRVDRSPEHFDVRVHSPSYSSI